MAKQAYHEEELEGEGLEEEEDSEDGEEEDEEERTHPRHVGHNIYILAHQVSDSVTSIVTPGMSLVTHTKSVTMSCLQNM